MTINQKGGFVESITRRAIWQHGVIIGWRLYSDGLFGLVLVGIEYKKR